MRRKCAGFEKVSANFKPAKAAGYLTCPHLFQRRDNYSAIYQFSNVLSFRINSIRRRYLMSLSPLSDQL